MDEVHGGKMFWCKSEFAIWVRANPHPGQLQKNKVQPLSVVRVPRTTEREEKKGKKERMGAIRPQTPNQDVGWSQWARRLG